MQNKLPAFDIRALAAIVFAWFCLLIAPASWAQTGASTALQPVPALTGRVIDQSHTLSSADVQSLSTQLQQLESETGAQLVVLMVPSTAPEDIAAYAFRVASSWKLGRRDVGDGAVIVVAKDERRMRIEVARALEGVLSDIMVARILDESMQPRFQANDYAGGLSSAIEKMSLLIKGEGELRRRPVLAIQFLEGEAAKRKVVELRRWLVEHGATSRDVDQSVLDDLGIPPVED